MKRKNILLLALAFTCFACSSNAVNPIKTPTEDGGLGGNQEGDNIPAQSTEALQNLLKRVSKITKYSYQVTTKIGGGETSFTSYYTPNAFYEDHGAGNINSFGYAQTKTDHYLFKYYLSEDEKEVIPSIYEYGGFSDTIEKVKELYGVFTLSNFSMLAWTTETFSARYVGANKFVITDIETASIFQFMTTFGSSISDYLSAVYIEILDADTNKFKATCDLGSNGSIEAIYTDLSKSETKIDFVDKKALDGTLMGVDYYKDTKEFFDLTKQNNYVLEGIHVKSEASETKAPYTIHCTNNYFLLDYQDTQYNDFGYVLVPENTEVEYTKNGVTTKQTLTYAACYGFSKNKEGQYYFDDFMGPVENGNIKYKEVDKLPDTGDTNVLYIVPDASGKKVVYEWAADSQGHYSFKRYSDWYDCVGDFYFNNMSATFYFSGTPLSEIGAHYFEKSRKEEKDYYYSTDPAIMSSLANGLFGWGFQPTTTWMDYIVEARLSVNKDDQDKVESAEVGLIVTASVGGNYSDQNIYYKVKDFGKGNVEEVETFLKEKGINIKGDVA